jgi:hypothetical protein
VKTSISVRYLAEFFLEWEIFLAKFVKNLTVILCSFFSRKSRRLWDNVENLGRPGRAYDGNIIPHILTACCITKATCRHSEYVKLIAFPLQQCLQERTLILRIYAHCFVINCFIHFWKAACIPDPYQFLPVFPRARRTVLYSTSLPDQLCSGKLFAKDQTCEFMMFWTLGCRLGAASPFIQILWLPQ